MKVKVKSPFFDARGLHKKGEIVDVEVLNPATMEPVIDEAKVAAKVETADKKEPKKTTRTKKAKE